VFARRFANRRQLRSYLGMTPSSYDSGSTMRCQGISKAGNQFARRIQRDLLKRRNPTTIESRPRKQGNRDPCMFGSE